MNKPDRRSRLETLQYIQAMLSELRGMAKSESCEMLVYLIDMAEAESRDLLIKNGSPAAPSV